MDRAQAFRRQAKRAARWRAAWARMARDPRGGGGGGEQVTLPYLDPAVKLSAPLEADPGED
jgi:hypothetical protein